MSGQSEKTKEPTVEQLAAECQARGWSFEALKAHDHFGREGVATDYLMEKDGVRVRFNRRGGGSISVRLVGWNGESANDVWPGAPLGSPLYTSPVGLYGDRPCSIGTREDTARQIMNEVSRDKVVKAMRKQLDGAALESQARIAALNDRRALLEKFLSKPSETPGFLSDKDNAS